MDAVIRRMELVTTWLLHPERFFTERFQDTRLTRVEMLLACVFGVAKYIDAASLRHVEKSWVALWSGALVAGVVGGVIGVFVRGLLFTLAARLCGKKEPDYTRALKAIAWSDAVVGIPIVALAIIETMQFESFGEAVASPHGAVALPIAYGWSALLRYRAALTAYELRPRPAVFWFVAVPVLLDGLILWGRQTHLI